MKRYIHFDTSIGSLNIGDQIINECFEAEMKQILSDGVVVKYPTHTPASHCYQNNRFNRHYRFCKGCDMKFIAGTNIISDNMLEPWPNWNVNIFNASPYKNAILVGCGRGCKKTPAKRLNIYTKLLYKRILSKYYIHSVRDESTKMILEKVGYKCINTGCVTLWKFNKNFCSSIKREKSDEVVFTLTDYCKNRTQDQLLIDILKKNYKKVYFWVQGTGDYEYFKSFKNTNNIVVIMPSLMEYRALLEKGGIDYVGTRLHAGIYAMRHKIRSIIISVDNRVRDMKETYNLVTIERDDIDSLDAMINSEFSTDIKINEKAIAEWKAQFKK